MAEKVQDKKIQKTPSGKSGPAGGASGPSQKPGDKGQRPETNPKKGNDGKKKW